MLSGNGRADRLRRVSRLLRLVGPLAETERELARVSPLAARLTRAVALPEPFVQRFAGATTILHATLAPEFSARLAGRDPYREFLRRFEWRNSILGREPAKQLLYLWLRSVFVNYHLAADRLDMAHAVEVRLPFLDHELFAYAGRIPVALLAKDGRQKHVLREAARPFVADAVYHGAKQPFYAPPSALRPGSRLHALVQDTLRGEAMASLPFFDQRAVIALLDRAPTLAPAAQTMLDPLLTVMTSLCLLHERFDL